MKVAMGAQPTRLCASYSTPELSRLLKQLYIILEMAQIGPASSAMENASSAEVGTATVR
jgi:hypothetical protein